jgi:hypothetical protein
MSLYYVGFEAGSSVDVRWWMARWRALSLTTGERWIVRA